MNVKLLRKVAKHILEEPKRFVMGIFLTTPKDEGGPTYYGDGEKEVRFAKCGTAGCIAGWACVLSGKPKTAYHRVPAIARRLLKIDVQREKVLFYEPNWPRDFREQYTSAKTTRSRAKIAAQRIEHFIKTGE